MQKPRKGTVPVPEVSARVDLNLAVPLGCNFLRAVQFRRSVLALLCVFGWLSGALHEAFEAAHLMVDHHHHSAAHHEHESDGSHSDDEAELDAEHAPVWARDGSRVNVPAFSGLLAGLLIFFVRPWNLAVRVDRPRIFARRREPALRVIWQFVQRCAAPATAPPTLN